MRCVRRTALLFAAWLPASLALLGKVPLGAPARQPGSDNSDALAGGGENQDADNVSRNVTPSGLQEWLETEPKFTSKQRFALTKRTNGTDNLCLNDRILPEVLVIGALMGGTTTFCNALRYSPSIIFPLAEQRWEGNTQFPTRWKEGHYFDRHVDDGIGYMLDDYGQCEQSARLIGVDGTTAYSVEYRIPAVVKMWYGPLFPRLNFVFIWREPLGRLHSHYYHTRARGSCPELNQMGFLAVARQIQSGGGVVWTGASRSPHGASCGSFLEGSLYVRILNRFFVYFEPAQFTFIPSRLIANDAENVHPAQGLWERLGARGLKPPVVRMNMRPHPRLEDDLPQDEIHGMRAWFKRYTGPEAIAYRVANTTAILHGFAGERDIPTVAAWIRGNW